MRICYPVLTHGSPKHLGRLVELLTGPGDDVVIHVDSKADDQPLKAAAPPSAQVSYLPQRTDIKWGSWSMMRAQIDMYRFARSQYPDADYYWLISGDSYPLRSPESIHAFLERHRSAEFVNVIRMPAPERAKPLRRVSHFRLDFDARTDRLRLPKKLLFLAAPRPYKRKLGGLLPYGGSQWMTLTAAAVDYLLADLDRRPELVRLAETGAHADEWLPHTVLANEPAFRDAMERALYWADYRPGTPAPRPPVLGAEQVNYLRAMIGDGKLTHEIMARKLNDTTLPLLDRIEADIWPLAKG